MSVKVNIAPKFVEASGGLTGATGTLTIHVTHEGALTTRFSGANVITSAPIVVKFVDGVLAEDVYIDTLQHDTHVDYYRFLFEYDAGVSFVTFARLPNNYSENVIDFDELHFKGTL